MRQIAAAMFLFLVPLIAEADVTGVIMTVDGRPVEGATIRLRRVLTPDAERLQLQKGDLDPIAAAATNKSGEFKLTVKERGNYELDITATAFAPESVPTDGQEDLAGLALRAAPEKGGRVTGGGKPLANALLIFRSGDGTARLVTRSAEDGSYRVPDPSKWKPVLNAFHADFAPLVTRQFEGEKPSFDIRLSGGVSLTGRLLSPDGKSGVEAELYVDDASVGRSKADGTFELRHLAADWKTITALSGDLVARGNRPLKAPLKMQKGSTIRGVIVDASTGVPLNGAVVTVGDEFGIFPPESTDAKGAFRVGAVLRDTKIQVTHATHEGKTVPLLLASNHPRRISLQRDGHIAGRVLTERNEPLGGAQVTVRSSAGRWYAHAGPLALSASDGRYVLRVTDTDEPLDVHASRAGFATAKNGPHDLETGEQKRGVHVTLTRGIGVTVAVTDTEDRPVARAAIAAVPIVANYGGGMTPVRDRWSDLPQTNSEGRVDLRLAPGTYDIVAKADGYSPGAMKQHKIAAASGTVTIKLELGNDVTGRVVSRNGNGVPDIGVGTSADGIAISTTTDADGRFTLSGLPPRPTVLWLRDAKNSFNVSKQVTAPARDVVIELMPTVTVSGRVTDRETKRALPEFTIRVAPQETKGYWSGEGITETIHDDTGQFSLTEIPVRPAELFAQAPGYTSAKLTLALDEGKPIADLELALERGGTIAGRVTGPNDEAIDQATVFVEGASSAGQQAVATDDRGEFVLRGVPPGEMAIVGQKNGFVSGRKKVTVTKGEVRADVQLSTGHTLTVRVVDASDAPVTDAEVNAMSGAANARYGRAISDSAGVAILKAMAPGAYQVNVSRRGFVTKQLPGIDPETTREVTARLDAGGTIRGRVVGLRPDELRNVRVSARSSPYMNSTAANAEGEFELEGVPAGQVRVHATSTAAGTTRMSEPVLVDLAAGGTGTAVVEFKEGLTVSGRVLLNGKTLDGASVSFRSATGNGFGAGTVDPSSRYTVTGLKPGEYVVVVTEYGRNLNASMKRTVERSGTIDIDIAERALRGRVVDEETGRGVGGAELVLESADASPMSGPRPEIRSDDDGSFLFSNVGAGAYQLRMSADNYAAVRESITVNDREDLDVTLRTKKTAGVALTLLDSRNGRPVNGEAFVRNGRGELIFESWGVGGEGSRRIPLAPGRYTAHVQANGLAITAVELQSPGSVQVILRPAGTLRVRTARPRLIRIVASDGTPYPVWGPSSFEPFSLSAGDTPIQALAAGSYTLELFDPPGTVAKSFPFVIREGETFNLALE